MRKLLLTAILTSLSLLASCISYSDKESNVTDAEEDSIMGTSEEDDDDVITDNLPDALSQIDRAIKNRDFSLAHEVLRSFPSKFGVGNSIWYNSYSGEIEEWDSNKKQKHFTRIQYVQKAISVMKAESDILLTKEDKEAEDLYLEYLADFDLGVNVVNLGEFWKSDQKSKDNEDYQEAVTIYNDYVISVIRKAMLKDNKELAKKLAFLLRDGLSFTVCPNRSYIYIWAYDTEAIDEAKQLIE